MATAAVFSDAYGRIHDLVGRAVSGITPEHFGTPPEPGTNSVAWLVWHLSRVQDDHVSAALGADELWANGFAARSGLPFPVEATGRGHGPEEVAALATVDPSLIAEYHDAVHARTAAWLPTLSEEDLARVVDTSYDPPVTLAVRLVSVISDNLQHAGQALFVRGILERR